MRRPVDEARLQEFLRMLGRESREDVRIYLAGGATAVLLGWRPSTIDIDLKVLPDSDQILQAIPRLKESIEINVELASPGDFIPEIPGWQDRSPFIHREGRASFHHYDLEAQSLAKIERGHGQDLLDAAEMVRRKLVDPSNLLRRFEQIAPMLYRYPAIDPPSFRSAVESFVRRQTKT
ncbi:MAG: DUF6036 family nucleotidyltransferase [Vicinamibacteria bacterium]